MAILAGILLAIGRPLFGRRWSGWFALAGIGLYTLMVGAGASVVRAAIMARLFIIAARLPAAAVPITLPPAAAVLSHSLVFGLTWLI